MNSFNGAGVALITPFNDDLTIDYTSLERLIEHQLAGGIDYLVSLGTTGETATLSLDEKKEVWKFTAEKVAGRVPLIAGIGGNNTQEVIHEIATAPLLGYSAILSVGPYYNKPTQEGIYQHYREIANKSLLPIILYNVPGRTGSHISADTIIRLANEFKGKIIAVKEASGSFDQFNKIMRDKPDDFFLISGDDPVTLPMMALGAVGIISVVGNAFPKEVSELTNLCSDHKFIDARKIHNSLLKITELCFQEGNPAGVKAVLNDLGISKEFLRLPLTPVSEKTRDSLKLELKRMLELNY